MATKGKFQMITGLKYTDEDSINLPIYSSFEFEKEHIRLYSNHLQYICQLNKSENFLLNYFFNKMSEKNIVRTSQRFKGYYAEDYKNLTGETVSESTIRNLIAGLNKKNFLVRMSVSRYMVNPFIAVRHDITEANRVSLMRIYLLQTGEVEPVTFKDINTDDNTTEIPD